MAFDLPTNFFQVPSSSDNIIVSDSEDQFYSIVERLKSQKVLSKDSFNKELPFFNFSSISKESQIKELFQDACDPNLYKTLIKNLINSPEGSSDLLTKRLSAMQVMGFAQIILYKVLPCCDLNCPNAPREVAPRNQYKDYEYSCPFYHHDKDKRRLVITPKIEDEFIYKANYLVEGKGGSEDKEKHSLNYFESMFHPLYYKMFKCKREYCNFSQFCPFFHSEEEKKTWDNMFSNFIRKDRVSYVKDKQKYYESSSNGQQQNMSSPTSPHSKTSDSRNYQTNRSNYKQRIGRNQQTGSPLYNKPKNMDWKIDRRTEPQSAGKWENNKKKNFRKDSGESYYETETSSPISFGTFYDSREMVNSRIC